MNESVSGALLNGPIVRGLRARCPKCGQGKLFDGYLKLAPACSACGASFAMADVGDGAAVFVMFVVGAIVVPLAFILQFSAHAPTWMTIAITGVVTIVLSLALLRAFKAVLFTLQWTHGAEQARLEE